ncbi:MAG: hypothetical protein ACJATA_000013 [Sphingobacteriales bacterium]|jgi:hypothetical protein
MLKNSISLLLLTLISATSFAQDTLITKSGQHFIGKVSILGDKMVQIEVIEDRFVQNREFKRKNIIQINFQDGRKERINNKNFFGYEYIDLASKVNMKKSSVGVEPFSPLTGGLSFSYETVIKDKYIFVGRTGFTSSNFTENVTTNFVKSAGYHFSAGIIFPMNKGGEKSNGTLQHNSFFFYPEIVFNNYAHVKERFSSYDQYNEETNRNEIFYETFQYQTTGITTSAILNFGKNILISPSLKFSFSTGLGYAFQKKLYFTDNKSGDSPLQDYFFNDIGYQSRGSFIFGSSSNLAGNLSFSLNYLF